MRCHVASCALVCVFQLVVTGASLQAQDAAAEAKDGDAPKDEFAKARLEYMQKALSKLHVVCDGDASHPATLQSEALFRWSNPIGEVEDGLLGVYAAEGGGRPAVISHYLVHGARMKYLEMHEFADVSPGKVELFRGNRLVWSPATRYSRFETLKADVTPSPTAAVRLSQMKRLAERFEIIDGFRAPKSEPQPQPLRLIPRPLYRYQDEKNGIVDGAIFTFVLATDPEACLALEVQREPAGEHWAYAVFPMTIYQLNAKFDGESVWKKPEAAIFGKADAAHYYSPYRGDAGEPAMKTLFSIPETPAAAKTKP